MGNRLSGVDLVSNTGPLIALASVDRLDLLSAMCNSVTIPEQVHQEFLRGGAQDCDLTPYQRATWIRVKSFEEAIDPLLETVLHQGEAAVIRLAGVLGIRTVLIDERKARKIARSVYGLDVIGTAGVLVEAKRAGLLSSVGDALDRIRRNGYWIHEDIVAAAEAQVGAV